MADKPVTREEKYLAYLTGDYTGELPKPITRKEKYLYELCLKGIGGEISPEEIKAAVNEYLEKNPVKPGATEEQAQQIKKNADDVASLKEDLTSKANKTALVKTDRKLDALWKLNQGISYEFQTDEAEAYQKTVPSGTKMASVKQIGGKTIVWNQYSKELGTETGWAYVPVNTSYYKELNEHVVYIKYKTIVKEIKKQAESYKRRFLVLGSETGERIEIGSEEVRASIFAIGRTMETKEIRTMPKNITGIFAYNYGDDKNATSAICDTWINIFDLTKMFGAGNEPSTPEEFEAMFPADYYPYNAGELMSAPVNEVIYFDTKNQETSYPIPQAILALDGYGESGNFVDFVEKKYHKGDMTIDVSGIMGDAFQEPLEVEAGGTLTFRNSHGDAYRIPVPSTEEYLVSLAEVAK